MPLSLAPFPETSYAEWTATEIDRRYRLAYLPMLAHEETARAQATISGPPPSAGTELLSVTRDGTDVGWLWVRRDGAFEVLDAEVDAPVEELLDLLVAQAGDETLLVDRKVGIATTDALSALPGWTPTATHMALDVTSAKYDGSVRLTDVSTATWDAYLAQTIEAYAAEIAASTTMTAEEAMAKSVEDHAELVPEGPDSAGQFIFDVWAGEEIVALLWIGEHSPKAGFVYDIVVAETARGRGLGRATMNAAAAWCRKAGYDVLGLNVFGANTVARALYDSLGYRVTDEQLRYDLTGG